MVGELHTSSIEEAEYEHSGEASPISMAEVAEVVKKLVTMDSPLRWTSSLTFSSVLLGSQG